MHNTFFGTLFLFFVSEIAVAQNIVRRSVPLVRSAVATSVARDLYANSKKQINEADLTTKEVSKEIPAPKGGDIYIENSSRNIVINTWNQPKVKVTISVYFVGESKLTDNEWFEKNNLSLKILGGVVKIKSGGVLGAGNYYSLGSGSNAVEIYGRGYEVFNSAGQAFDTKGDVKKIMTITVPTGSKLDVENKYTDVTLADNISDVNVDISNGNLEAGNLTTFILRSKYSNINVGDIKTAEIEMTDGRFSARNIDYLDIDSKYSNIEMAAVKKIEMKSTNDEYELEEAGDVRGRKNYGNLRITRLNNSFELEGTNADVKIRNTGPSLSHIKLDDKYAEIRIPLRNTKSYTLDFSGAYSAVYGNFEKVPVAERAMDRGEKIPSSRNANGNITATTLPEKIYQDTTHGSILATTVPLTVRSVQLTPVWRVDSGPSRFKSIVGDGKGLKININCQNCSVDFK